MMSLSNVIKSPESGNKKKVIRVNQVIDPLWDMTYEKTDPESPEKQLAEKTADAKRRAEQMIADAENRKKQFEIWQEKASAKAAKERETAYHQKEKEGYDAGLKRGMRESQKIYAEKIAQANALIDQAHESGRRYLKEAEPEILKLSMAIAEKIIGTSVALDEDKWFSLVTKAVKEVRDQKTIKIMVSPAHFESINRHRRILDDMVRDAEVFIYADGDLPENGCAIETSFGKIDAGVDSQLQVIREKLSELMEEDGQ